MGPYNGSFSFTPSTTTSFTLPNSLTLNAAPNNLAANNQPNHMRLENLGVHNGKTIAMRVDNTSAYRPFRIQQNRKYNEFMLQVNLHPIQDYAGVDSPYDIVQNLPAPMRALVPMVVR